MKHIINAIKLIPFILRKHKWICYYKGEKYHYIDKQSFDNAIRSGWSQWKCECGIENCPYLKKTGSKLNRYLQLIISNEN